MVADFLADAKRLEGRLSWKPKSTRGDYVWTSHLVVVLSGRHRAADLHLTAHLTREPRKYGFTLIWRGAKILRLDVEPGATHFNISTKTSVSGTHWQRWPDDEAEPDLRALDHRGWLTAFCGRANIAFEPDQYKAPPFKTYQYEMPL
ncbi:hypothetical protein [Caenispirillum bisanense]|uniref:hypothetical protein n=1 Tax=Caenispirillum bisanense TaxID=414052 RepID=UPI000BE42E83|nr:hypothetical protein [Caenispirillum bisanense]